MPKPTNRTCFGHREPAPRGAWRQRRDPITVTIGVGTPAEATSADALLKLADERLDAGKRAGCNRVIGSA